MIAFEENEHTLFGQDGFEAVVQKWLQLKNRWEFMTWPGLHRKPVIGIQYSVGRVPNTD